LIEHRFVFMKAAKVGHPEDLHETNGNAELPDGKISIQKHARALKKRQVQRAGALTVSGDGWRRTEVNASGFAAHMRPEKRAPQDDTNSWNPIPDVPSVAAQAIR
jgi:hypothetical protein